MPTLFLIYKMQNMLRTVATQHILEALERILGAGNEHRIIGRVGHRVGGRWRGRYVYDCVGCAAGHAAARTGSRSVCRIGGGRSKWRFGQARAERPAEL